MVPHGSEKNSREDSTGQLEQLRLDRVHTSQGGNLGTSRVLLPDPAPIFPSSPSLTGLRPSALHTAKELCKDLGALYTARNFHRSALLGSPPVARLRGSLGLRD